MIILQVKSLVSRRSVLKCFDLILQPASTNNQDMFRNEKN